MNLKLAAQTQAQRDLDGFRPREYKAPPKDLTEVKCRIIRPCWVRMTESAPMQIAKPGEVLLLPRWLADELAGNGKASLL